MTVGVYPGSVSSTLVPDIDDPYDESVYGSVVDVGGTELNSVDKKFKDGIASNIFLIYRNYNC